MRSSHDHSSMSTLIAIPSMQCVPTTMRQSVVPASRGRIAVIVRKIGFLIVLAHAIIFAAQIDGDLKLWHKISITLTGPQSSESGTPNPFSDYRLDVLFTGPSGQTYRVPGYYAADGNTAESGAGSGDKWRVCFCPSEAGSWHYIVQFVKGSFVAAQTSGGTSAGFCDGDSGNFTVVPNNSVAGDRDLRAKGKLEYVGEHYLRFKGDGSYFLKCGANSPETFLEYNDFDGTERNLDYTAHSNAWRTGDPTWKNGKGKGIIGAVNYLSSLGVNAIYFLTMNSYGDGKKVYPWTGVDNYYQYDCSKLDQWDIVFGHMDVMGIMLHVILTETENESYFEIKENGSAGGFAQSRKIYYREMVARFGYHMAISWNLGEENGWDDPSSSIYKKGNTTQQRKDFSDYLRRLVFYQDHICVHNGPSTDDGIFTPLLGHASMSGPSIQWDAGIGIHAKVLRWRKASQQNGHPWVVCLDEPYTSTLQSDDAYRKNEVWGTFMAGGAGCEFYKDADLALDDFTPYAEKFRSARRAVDFFQNNTRLSRLRPADSLASGNSGAYCLADSTQLYVVYLRNGGVVSLNLVAAPGAYDLAWFDPRNAGKLIVGANPHIQGGAVVSLGTPPNNSTMDWVALLRNSEVTGNVPRAANGTGAMDKSLAMRVCGNKLDFSLPSPARVALRLYGINGKLLYQVCDKEFSAGRHLVALYGRRPAPGTYIVGISGKKELSARIAITGK